ncbi:MAG: hypothetical protein JWM98_1808 [Thermoleophilia bacterium]|nr:hypothetical protein [Thermoleophilia bacterium]
MTVAPNPDPDSAAAIRQRRAELGLSHAKFARLCRLDPATIRALEVIPDPEAEDEKKAKPKRPDWVTLCKLVKFAGMDPRTLIGEPVEVDLAAVGLAA